MAVGPFDPVASCVTGGTAVAMPYLWFLLKVRQLRGICRVAEVAALLHTRRGIAKGLRNDMAGIQGLVQTLGTVLANSVDFNQVPATIRVSGGRVELEMSCGMADASVKTPCASSHLPSRPREAST